MPSSLGTLARQPARVAVVLVVALLMTFLASDVFAHGGSGENADNHLGTDCDGAGSTAPGPPCVSSVEKVAGVEVDGDLTAGDAAGSGSVTVCSITVQRHGGPAGSDGKDWDACPRTPPASSGEIFGDATDALINENGAAPPAKCPPVLNPVPAAPASVFWNGGPGFLICDRSVYMSDPDEKDDVFTQGSSTNAEKQWAVSTPGAPKKGDLELAGFFRGDHVPGDTAGSPGDDWIVGFIAKTDRDGDSHNFFELRQAACSTNLSVIASCPRSSGDVLITMDTSSVDNKIAIKVYEWFEFADFPAAPPCPSLSSSLSPTCKGDGVDETAFGDDCVLPSGGTLTDKTSGCWDIVPGSHPEIIGVFNFDGVSDNGGGVPPENADDEILAGPWGAFGCERTTGNNQTGCRPRTQHPGRSFLEFAVNLTDLGIEPECPGFGTLFGGGRSSSSLTAELKDALPALNLPLECSIAWEKRDGTRLVSGSHPLQGGATFTVSGSPGPFACLDDDTNPDPLALDATQNDEAILITVADNGPLDADPDAGQILLAGGCFGTFTITETVAPAGYAKDSDFTRVITVASGNLTPVVGTQGTDDHNDGDGTGSACSDSSADPTGDECDFHNRLGTIEWEKRDESSPDVNGKHPLQGGAKFSVSPNPFFCRSPSADPGIFQDNAAGIDADPDNGQFRLERVCLNADGSSRQYTIKEEEAPSGFGLDDDVDRLVTVSATALDQVVGSALGSPATSLDDHEGTGTGIADCTGSPDECDFHNRRGSLFWQKRAKDASNTTADFCPGSATMRCPLLGGATFSINKNPHTGAAGAFAVTDCVIGPCSGEDQDPDPGEICIDAVVLNIPLAITETASPDSAKWKKSDATLNVTVTSSSTCAGTPTDAGDFVNTPLSQIEVIFTSLAGAGVTKASIVCKDPSGAVIPAVSEDGAPDPALDDFDEVFTGLEPVANIATDKYTCEIVIDP